MTKTEIIAKATNSRGHYVRLQKRGNAFDVTYNSTGMTWMYKAKAVSEQTARNEFELQAM